MKAMICFLGVLFSYLPAHAALSPYYETVVEIEAILEDPSVASQIEGHGFYGISKNGNNVYKIATVDGCVLNVEVNYQNFGMPGPQQFWLKIDPLDCEGYSWYF